MVSNGGLTALLPAKIRNELMFEEKFIQLKNQPVNDGIEEGPCELVSFLLKVPAKTAKTRS